MKRASTTVIGAFVVGAVVLGVVAVGVLGSGRFFRHLYPAVLFFNGDVNGLKVGAPVKFKGIPVGTVKSVLLSLGEVIGTRDPSQPFHVPVIIELRDSLGATIVVVTHELASIFTIATTSVFLDVEARTITARGDPKELLQHGNDAVRRFLSRGGKSDTGGTDEAR